MIPEPRYEGRWSGCNKCVFIGSHDVYDVYSCGKIEYYSVLDERGLFAEVHYEDGQLPALQRIIKFAKESMVLAREDEDDPSISPNARPNVSKAI